jgi:hypothetical protein
MVGVRKGNHYGEAAGGKAEQIETLLLAGKGAAADILDRCDPVIGVNYLLTHLESHSRTLLRGQCSEQHLKPNCQSCQYAVHQS